MDQYVCLYLSTGKELIGKIDCRDSQSVNIENPAEIIRLHYDEEANISMMLFPFMSYTTDSLFTFNRKYIITEKDPNDKMIQYYKDFIEVNEEEIQDEEAVSQVNTEGTVH